MEVKFTRKDGSSVVEEFDEYTVDSTAKNTHHDVVLINHVDGAPEPDHKNRHRIVTQVEGQNAGSPRYIRAEFEDGRILGSVDDEALTEDEQEISEVEADGVLTEEEIDHLSHADLAAELEKRNVEVPKLKEDRVAALKKAVA
jgi:hypothetical protein